MLNQLREFLSAVQFFTRIPVPAWVGHEAQQLNQAARYLPAVGLLVGGLAAAVWWLAAQWLPPAVAVLLGMAAGLLLTGAMHEDGLSDFADGFGGGHARDRVLTIMKDSRVGVFGVLALVLVLWLKYTALLALAARSFPAALSALVAAHAVSRLLAVSLMVTQQYVRDDDSARAKPAAQRMSSTNFAVAVLLGGLAAVLPLCFQVNLQAWLAGLTWAILVRAYLAWRIHQRLGGYTGDCLGAVQQLTELAFYLGLLAAWRA